jgi:hypothetical protein
MKLKDTHILLLVIIVACAVRFYNFFQIPYTHDEFSALFRTYYTCFSDLIEKGVLIDGHPAGIQVFLFYWTRLFGYDEWVVKLPFTLCGIGSVYLLYLIGKKWYNVTVGLISASFLATIQYTVMYSQIARPYISGLFFSLCMVHFWWKILSEPRNKLIWNSLLYIISASLCAYNHYFSLLFAIILGLSGLFLVERKFLLKYVISGLTIFLLFLPHFNIFLFQLKAGGVEGWLGKPHNDFIIYYLKYIFHFSPFLGLLVVFIALFGLKGFNKYDFNKKHFLLSLSWFMLTFLIGFFYSRFINGVLQYSVLIFSFPFLFFILFGHIRVQKTGINLIIVSMILSVNIFSLIKERRHYELFYNSPFEQILIDQTNIRKSNPGILSLIDSHKRISSYYFLKRDIDTSFTWYDSFASERDLINYLREHNQQFEKLFFGCLSGSNPLIIPIIMEYYPSIVWQKNYAGGTSYLFSKDSTNTRAVIELLDFESVRPNWSAFKKENLIDTMRYSGMHSYLIDSTSEWSPAYSRALKEIITNENNFIDIAVKCYYSVSMDDIILVASLDAKNESVGWTGYPFTTFVSSDSTKNHWFTVYCTLKLSDAYQHNRHILFKTYIWNRGRQNLIIDDFTIKLRIGNPIIYGLFEKI